MSVLKLSDPAKLDMRDIFSYTLQTWGEDQLLVYKNKIDGALHTIMQNPYIGRRASGKITLHVFDVERHRIFYRIEGEIVYIVRILHKRMKASGHLHSEKRLLDMIRRAPNSGDELPL